MSLTLGVSGAIIDFRKNRIRRVLGVDGCKSFQRFFKFQTAYLCSKSYKQLNPLVAGRVRLNGNNGCKLMTSGLQLVEKISGQVRLNSSTFLHCSIYLNCNLVLIQVNICFSFAIFLKSFIFSGIIYVHFIGCVTDGVWVKLDCPKATNC